MNYLKNDKGFSLVELIVTVSLMVIALGITTLSLGNINEARLNGAAEEFAADARLLQSDSMYSYDKIYKLVWEYSGNQAGYKVYMSEATTPPVYSVIKEVKLSSDIKVELEGKEFNNADYVSDVNKRTLTFDKSNGNVEKPLITVGSDGYTFLFTSHDLGKTKQVSIIELTGRVYIDD